MIKLVPIIAVRLCPDKVQAIINMPQLTRQLRPISQNDREIDTVRDDRTRGFRYYELENPTGG